MHANFFHTNQKSTRQVDQGYFVEIRTHVDV